MALHALLLVVLYASKSVQAQAIWRRYSHASIVAQNWLYIDGGEVTYENDSSAAPVNNTFAIDLTRDWTNSTFAKSIIERPPSILPFNHQVFWWDETDDVIYRFGGELSGYRSVDAPAITPQESIWGLNPDGQGGGSWKEYLGPTSDKPFPQNILRPSRGFYGDDGKNGYFFGGNVNRASTPSITLEWGVTTFAPGLLTFNFASLTLTNDTNVATQTTSTSWVPPGRILHAPSFGTSGILVAIGGDFGQLEAGGPFNNISIFDLESKRWSYQAATGTIPSPRSSFCAVGAQGKDNSTFEIFIQGGCVNRGCSSGVTVEPVEESESADVYILSLPAFQWFKANNPSGGARAFHTCNTAGNNQMVVIGGFDYTYNVRGAFGDLDPWTQQIAVFDMTALQWKDGYESSADPYDAPETVKQFYRSQPKYPASWSTPDVQQLFQASSPNSTNPTQPEQTPQPSPGPSSGASASHLSKGQIAGISVGAASAVLVLLGLLLLAYRHRSSKQAEAQPVGLVSKSEMSSHGTSGASEMQARESVDHGKPGRYTYQNELRGDLGGAEIRGDVGAVELGVHDVVTRP